MRNPAMFAIIFALLVAQTSRSEHEVSADEKANGIAVALTDADGKPCTTGYVRTYPNPRPKDWSGDQPRNFDLKDGKCFVPISNFGEQKSFKIVLYPDGFAPYELRWPDTSKKPLPQELVFKMPERASAPIGGRIVDADGKPIKGAVVQFSVSLVGRQNHPDNMISKYAQWINTDANGYWIYQVLPKEQWEQDFDLSIEHATYPKLRFSNGQTFKDFAVKDADGKFSKTIVMPKGLPLQGKIVDEQGHPVAGVLVHCNAAWRDPDKPYGHEAVKTDANGEFLFDNCSPKGELRTIDIGVCHNDFAPDVISLTEITPGMKPLNIVLKKGKKVVLKAVAQDGKPIDGMRIVSSHWKNFWGPATGTHRLFVDADQWGAVKTDKDGRFIWENAPDNRFDLTIGNENYQNVKIDYETLKYGGEENVYVFKPLIDVAGTVVDAETGEPIPGFSVTEWFSFKSSGGSGGLIREFGSQSAKEGKFIRKVGRRFGEFDNYHLRVEADGYEGLQSEDLIAKTGAVSLEFKLKKATGEFANHLTGTVHQPDGKPAANTRIGIATAGAGIQTQGTSFHTGIRRESKTDNAGKFTISRSEMSIGDQDYKLLFLHDTGMLQMSKEEFEKHAGPITLQAWGRIEGTVRTGSKPLPNAPLYWSMDSDRNDPESGKANIQLFGDWNQQADADGRFSFRVFPGKGRVGRRPAFSMQKFDVKPGETATVMLGGVGRPVVGKLVPSKEFETSPDWTFAQVTCFMTPEKIDVAGINADLEKLHEKMMPKELLEEKSPVKQTELFNVWKETEEGKKFQAACKAITGDVMAIHDRNKEKQEKTTFCTVAKDGTFQLDNVQEGDWMLTVRLGASNGIEAVPGRFEQIGSLEYEFTIATISGGVSDEPLDLGTLQVKRLAKQNPFLKVGDLAYEFELVKIEPIAENGKFEDKGKKLRLSDFKGKHVILDFWATWCGPCLVKLPELKALYEKIKNDDRFVMIGISLDEVGSEEMLGKFIAKREMPWQHGLSGSWQSDTARTYGIQAIPALLLIGPDGKVLLSNPSIDDLTKRVASD